MKTAPGSMPWEQAARAALENVPFFVRKKVKARIEATALAQGRSCVTLKDVHLARKAFMEGQETMITGFKVENCFASGGCPNRVLETDALVRRLEFCLSSQDLLSFLKKRVEGHLRFHHEFRVSVAGCPNACSQPQIRDMGIFALRFPGISQKDCSRCGLCVAVCPDRALLLKEDGIGVDRNRCMGCGLCIAACGEGVLKVQEEGFRILLGGRLGRHPRLGIPLPGLYTADAAEALLLSVLAFWKSGTGPVERFSRMLQPEDLGRFC
jgi:dissimilatory sulfite reductase (desulfoviridin) alpha/beta subunit